MNKHLTKTRSTLLRNKLSKLVSRVQSSSNPSGSGTDLVTLEEALTEAMQALSKFYVGLSDPLFVPNNAVTDTAPSLTEYNNNFSMIKDDLDVVFSEFENLETVVLGNFNYMISRLNRLNRRAKLVSSDLADYILFANYPSKDAIFFGDSFNNLSRIEVQSPLLNYLQCEINQAEGVVTLPVKKSEQESIEVTEIPVINQDSNGTPGNNYEANASYNGTISLITDNNADTWFEYERVLDTDDGKNLILDFTLNLGTSKVINFIRINPNNFGARTQVSIRTIDTSVDGKEFVSIKDDIPIADFVEQDEANIFSLAPSSSKYAGQGLFTFTPRKARYIRIVLVQSTPYTIYTSAGAAKHRYAIGIRDVHVEALPYDLKGEIISKSYSSLDEVKKVVLLSNQNPAPETVSKLATIEHFVSPDNGISWYGIRPKVSEGLANVDQETPELLDFNGVDSDSIPTASPVKSLRYKALLTRNSDAFTGESDELAQIIESITELHSSPTTTPFDIKLQHTPVDNTLKLVDPNYGSRGIDDTKYSIALGTGYKLKLHLPIKIKHDNEKNWYVGIMGISEAGYFLDSIEPQDIYIGGELWTNDLSSSSGAADKHYSLDFEAGTLETGDGTTGKAVPAGVPISLVLAEERLYPSLGEHVATLDYPTVADKQQVTIQRVGKISQKSQVLKPGATRHQLDEDIVSDSAYRVTFSNTTVFVSAQEKDYPSQLSAHGDWYLNRETGLLQHVTPISTKTKTTATYFYQPRCTLADNEWSFVDSNGGVANAVSINDSVYETYNITSTKSESVTPNSQYHCFANLALVPGSVTFVTSSGVIASGVYNDEVSYIDGRTELLSVLETREEISAITGTNDSATTVSNSFRLKINTDSIYEVSFSRPDIFITDVTPAVPSIVGEYSVNRSAGTYSVRVNQDYDEPGYVTYYYNNPSVNRAGRYSINYKLGEAFFYTTTGAADKVYYDYTDYRIKYPIAREVSSKDWSFDKTDNRLTIKDREILRNMRSPRTSDAGTVTPQNYYQVSYKYVKKTRDDISELEPYFSPVLKDYALKVITASRMI